MVMDREKRMEAYAKRMEDNKRAAAKESELVKRLVRALCETEAGISFLKYLEKRCHKDHTTLNGLSSLVTIEQALLMGEGRRILYLDIESGMTEEDKVKVLRYKFPYELTEIKSKGE